MDFADVKAVMENTGTSLMGIGRASGENRAAEAAKQAINSPLLDISIHGAKGVLFNISGGTDLTMMEVNEAANVIVESIDPEAKVIFGAITDESLKKGEIKVTVIATGFGDEVSKKIISRSSFRPNIGLKKSESRIEKFFEKEGLKREESGNIPEKEIIQAPEKKVSEYAGNQDIISKVTPVQGNKKYETPAFERGEVEKEEKAFESKINPLKYNDEIDIPAFIRRKMIKKDYEDED